MLTNKLTRVVDWRTIDRGMGVYAKGKVALRSGDESLVEARVQGGDAVSGTTYYDVRITRDEEALVASCTCPYFAEVNRVCKHVWAVILAAKNKHYLMGGRPPPSTIRSALVNGEFADEHDEYERTLNKESGWAERREADPDDPSIPLRAPSKPPPKWKGFLKQAGMEPAHLRLTQREPRFARTFYYVLIGADKWDAACVIQLFCREMRKDGTAGKMKSIRLPASQFDQIDEPDRTLISMLAGLPPAQAQYSSSSNYGSFVVERSADAHEVTREVLPILMPQLCATGRCGMISPTNPDDFTALEWDETGVCEFVLELKPGAKKGIYEFNGFLTRGGERVELKVSRPASPIVGIGNKLMRLEDSGCAKLMIALKETGAQEVPKADVMAFLGTLAKSPRLPRLECPPDMNIAERSTLTARKLAVLDKSLEPDDPAAELRSNVTFDYEGIIVPDDHASPQYFDPGTKSFVRRDRQKELQARKLLEELGFRKKSERNDWYSTKPPAWCIAPKALPGAMTRLMLDGWQVEIAGGLLAPATSFNVSVSSGIDWFDLQASADFGGRTVALPLLLAALRRGDSTIRLSDGQMGILPEAWLKELASLAQLGDATKDGIRFKRSQAALLDALLATQPQARVDAAFQKVRAVLAKFSGIAPSQPPESFHGELREYQCEGLGWMLFLRDFGFGGCLADDMGLGKTVQVLALLEERRTTRPKNERAPSLVVVPKSLVGNWKDEAARFSPQLKVLDLTGPDRAERYEKLNDADVALITYGTARLDAIRLKDILFDYVILDEAQTIKNATTDQAKAVRLLNGRHRLAMSGTPVENRLSDLWSIFEFLNPGMLGGVRVFSGAGKMSSTDEAARLLLRRALKPFILRRTKQQVAKDLPDKTEQTIFCDLEPAQRKLYDELKDHYRAKLLGVGKWDALQKNKIQVLEALLRLRQAALHPGLIDKNLQGEDCAKLDWLMDQLDEVHEEGHKALVFSQFTSFLSIVQTKLKERGVDYEYLDGKTQDRAERVARFQSDPNCKLFLISLKAGGLGLNLTSAEYVFLLDPWWNPAVEAQAIDRTHRIGQTQNVFAYRIIARDTVEEKVLELQRQKRELADSIINADNSLVSGMTSSDLELLLS